jgi:hypothetical protein
MPRIVRPVKVFLLLGAFAVSAQASPEEGPYVPPTCASAGGPTCKCDLGKMQPQAAATTNDFSINMKLGSTLYKNCQHYAEAPNKGPKSHMNLVRWYMTGRHSNVDDWGLLGPSVSPANATRIVYCDSDGTTAVPGWLYIEYRRESEADRP